MADSVKTIQKDMNVKGQAIRQVPCLREWQSRDFHSLLGQVAQFKLLQKALFRK